MTADQKPAGQLSKAERQAAYDAWYVAEIKKGLDDLDAGRVVSNEEVDKKCEALLKKLHRKHAPKVA